MDVFSIVVVAMGCIVTALLLIGFLREVIRGRSGRPQPPL